MSLVVMVTQSARESAGSELSSQLPAWLASQGGARRKHAGRDGGR